MTGPAWPPAAVEDAARAANEYDDARRWLAQPLRAPVPPVAVEVWVYDLAVELILLVRHRWRGWVPPGGRVEPTETPRAAAIRELREETGLRVNPLQRPAAVAIRSYHPNWTPTLGLSYAAIVDATVPLHGEPGQPVAWTALDRDWPSYFPEDPQRIRRFAAELAPSGPAAAPAGPGQGPREGYGG